MRRIIRNAYVLFSMMLMLVMSMPNVVFADNASNDKVAINVKVPAGWDEPCAWAWDDAGNNVFDAWPGGECEVRTDNEGWYYVWLPKWANHLIINANAGTVQTDALDISGEDTWITISDDGNIEITTEAITDGTTPEYVETFVVHAKVDESWSNPGLWAWSAPDGTNAFEAWPGKAMKQSDDGWYIAKAPVFVNSIIINANEGSVQTEDLSIDAAEIWVTVDKDGKADFSYKDPDKAAVQNITIYVKAPSDWNTPNLWAWSAPDGTNVFTKWPGEPLEEKDGWLQKEIPGWVNSVIVNGNEGSIQTADISIETGKDVWLVVNSDEDYSVTYEEAVIAIEEQAVSTTEKTEGLTDTQKGNSVVLPIIIVVVLVAAVVVVIFIKKKK